MFTPCTDKRVAVFFADGCEEIEGLSVVDVLYRAGIPCDKVSISDSLSVTSSHQVTFLTDKLLSQVSFDDYSMLVLPGGLPGTTNLEACKPLMQAVDAFASDGCPLAAICAAPSIYAKRGLLVGKEPIFLKTRFVLMVLLLPARVQEQRLSLAWRLSVIL